MDCRICQLTWSTADDWRQAHAVTGLMQCPGIFVEKSGAGLFHPERDYRLYVDGLVVERDQLREENRLLKGQHAVACKRAVDAEAEAKLWMGKTYEARADACTSGGDQILKIRQLEAELANCREHEGMILHEQRPDVQAENAELRRKVEALEAREGRRQAELNELRRGEGGDGLACPVCGGSGHKDDCDYTVLAERALLALGRRQDYWPASGRNGVVWAAKNDCSWADALKMTEAALKNEKVKP